MYDRDFKRDAYLAMGVAEVWLVDADDRSVMIYRRGIAAEVARDRIVWSVPGHDAQVMIELSELFA